MSGVDLVQGTLELLVLKTLSRGEAMHGFEVLRWLRDATEGALLVEGEWGISEKGRRAKYYSLTAAGRAELAREEARWTRYLRAWEMISLAVAGAAGRPA